MIPSSSSSSTSRRPLSAASQRPATSLSHHTNQYGSSSSVISLARPSSSASIRPTSRASYRPKSRQQKLTAAKLLPFCQDVVTRVFGEPNEDDEEQETKHHQLVDWSVKQLGLEGSNKAALTLDMDAVSRMVRGHIEKARIKSQDTLATALEKTLEKVQEQAQGERDLDDEIKKSRLPAHVQFILAMSSAPQPSTLTYASLYMHALENPPDPAKSDELIWKQILDEDPYEGDHWVGVPGGIPLPRKRQIRDKAIDSDDNNDDDLLDDIDDINTSPSLSPLNSDDLALDDTDSDFERESPSNLDKTPSASAPNTQPDSSKVHTVHRPVYTTYAYRQELEHLKTKQYWQPDWQMDPEVSQRQQQRGTFNIGEASTLGPTLQRVLSKSTSADQQLPLELILSAERYIEEQDAVRDVLIALQGRNNVLFDKNFNTTKNTPRLLHFSLDSQQSLLGIIGSSCRTIQRLRRFVGTIMDYSSSARSRGPSVSMTTATTTTGSTLERMKTVRMGKITRTLEAFVDAIDAEIRLLEVWCSGREEAWLRALGGVTAAADAPVVSLLGTEKAFRDRFEDSFRVLLDVVIQVLGISRPVNSSSEEKSALDQEEWFIPTRSPSLTTALLLNTLFVTVQQRLERGDKVTADALMRVFVRTAEPVWAMVERWMRFGFQMNSTSASVGQGQGQDTSSLEEEFFIESNGLGVELGVLGLLDPDFWRQGYSLRDGGSGRFSESVFPNDDDDGLSVPSSPATTVAKEKRICIPSFLEHVALTVLESGKTMGLLRALGMDVQFLDDDSDEVRLLGKWVWVSFQRLVEDSGSGPELGPGSKEESNMDPGDSLFSVSIDRLSRLISDKLTPYGQASGSLLAKVIVEQCDFRTHLKAIESLYLMRRGDILSDFADVLFAKMDSKQNWTDFHFLNTAFSDIVSASNNVTNVNEFLQIPLIRLSYRDRGTYQQKHSVQSRTVKALDGLSLEYAVPFPLTYIFTPANLQTYNRIFVFLLQVRRGKSLLDNILVRGASAGSSGQPGLKAFYAMRNRLSWFVNAFFNFITTYVIHTQVAAFQKLLTNDRSQSFDQMIIAHEEHLERLQSRCLLQAKTNALYRAILSILDMSLNFSDLFGAFAGDVTMHDISTHSVVLKHHRSRRQRRRRRNVISLSFAMRAYPESESSDSEGDHNEVETEYSYSVSLNTSTLTESDDLFTKINKMSSDLDGLVRFVRRGIETLAGGTGDASATFGVLAFALEDWDL
ncbi:hypothetical protein GYMLUDRAFT_36439 [Collybiopsis luxurians FD-317 M1]|nr:hypothetical protein GYMLUDRAFT_36439 [Collybiopsis luxurians FD-317 M1]